MQTEIFSLIIQSVEVLCLNSDLLYFENYLKVGRHLIKTANLSKLRVKILEKLKFCLNWLALYFPSACGVFLQIRILFQFEENVLYLWFGVLATLCSISVFRCDSKKRFFDDLFKAGEHLINNAISSIRMYKKSALACMKCN